MSEEAGSGTWMGRRSTGTGDGSEVSGNGGGLSVRKSACSLVLVDSTISIETELGGEDGGGLVGTGDRGRWCSWH